MRVEVELLGIILYFCAQLLHTEETWGREAEVGGGSPADVTPHWSLQHLCLLLYMQ